MFPKVEWNGIFFDFGGFETAPTRSGRFIQFARGFGIGLENKHIEASEHMEREINASHPGSKILIVIDISFI